MRNAQICFWLLMMASAVSAVDEDRFLLTNPVNGAFQLHLQRKREAEMAIHVGGQWRGGLLHAMPLAMNEVAVANKEYDLIYALRRPNDMYLLQTYRSGVTMMCPLNVSLWLTTMDGVFTFLHGQEQCTIEDGRQDSVVRHFLRQILLLIRNS